MYLVPLKTAVVEAFRATFDSMNYPEPDFQNIVISIEYPMTESSYPGLWVTYEDTQELSIAGIAHLETINNQDGSFTEVTRWVFQGTVTVTAVALSSLERDRLYDEVVRTYAFGGQNQALSVFRTKIEENDFIGMNFNFDDMQPSGDGASPGTPWGTDEIIYEKSLSMDVRGEFVGDPKTQGLVALSKVIFEGYTGDTAPPFPDDPNATTETDSEFFDTTQWH